MKRKILVLALAGMMAATSLTGCSSFREDDVAVTVDDVEITAGVANFYARYMQAQYETYYSAYLGDDMWNTEAEEGKTYEEAVKESVLESLEVMVLLEAHMEEYGVSLSEEEEQVIEDAVAEFQDTNDEENKDKVSGSEETVRRVMTLIAIQQKMGEAIEAGADTEVSDEEAAQKSMQYVLFSYTNTNEDGESEDMTDEEKAAVKSQAEAFAEGAKEAEDFEAYAAEQGTEASTLAFDSETTSPSEELIQAADALGEGEMTDVIETDSGCYVAKVTSLLDREATDSKKESIVSERKSELYTNTVDGWKEEADIQVNESVWAKVDFNELKVTVKEAEEETDTTDTSTDETDETDETITGDAEDAAE